MTPSKVDPHPSASVGLRLERWSATSGNERRSRANVVLWGGGHRWRANADGNGTIDALMRAVDNALAPLLGDGVVLTSYNVKAEGAGHESRATVSLRVHRRSDPPGPRYPGRAAHENLLEASVVAYLAGINALIADEGVDIASLVPAPGQTARHDTGSDHPSSATDRIMSVYNG